jgi:glutamate synthase (NADPH/NADH)
VAIPDSFFASVLLSERGTTLPATGQYAVGQLFLPQNARQREQCRRIMENVAQQLGHETLAWRVVPTDNTDLGQSALNTEPIIEQWFITAHGKLDKLETEQQVGYITSTSISA